MRAVMLVGLLGLGTLACSEGEGDPAGRSELDTRLVAHAVVEGRPSAAGLAYLEQVVAAHRDADAIADPLARAERLLAALELPIPEGDGTAEIAALELAARAAEALLEAKSAEADARVVALLGPLLPTERSLPIDRASARCLVALGDAAARTGDHGSAMGSYARALEMLSLLLEEVDS
jgi:hypothetical protein